MTHAPTYTDAYTFITQKARVLLYLKEIILIHELAHESKIILHVLIGTNV